MYFSKRISFDYDNKFGMKDFNSELDKRRNAIYFPPFPAGDFSRKFRFIEDVPNDMKSGK